jgi:RNA polymerase sigma factor (sigma-70 family)
VDDPRLIELRAARETFSAMVERIRPELFRYCARMMGSAIDGEDVVQETLARAFYELSELRELPALRTWLFRIAHNLSINALVARGRRGGDRPLDEETDDAPAANPSADSVLDQAQTVQLAIGRFLGLAPAQRACVILSDVLDCSLEEIADALDLTVPAVKAALHRGRVRLSELSGDPMPTPRERSAQIVHYAELFNARDWEGIRAMLARDVKLDVVNREKRRGAGNVSRYFSNYARHTDWHLTAVWLDDREVLAVRRDASDIRPSYVIEVSFRGDAIVAIRDFRYASHLVDEATFELGA